MRHLDSRGKSFYWSAVIYEDSQVGLQAAMHILPLFRAGRPRRPAPLRRRGNCLLRKEQKLPMRGKKRFGSVGRGGASGAGWPNGPGCAGRAKRARQRIHNGVVAQHREVSRRCHARSACWASASPATPRSTYSYLTESPHQSLFFGKISSPTTSDPWPQPAVRSLERRSWAASSSPAAESIPPPLAKTFPALETRVAHAKLVRNSNPYFFFSLSPLLSPSLSSFRLFLFRYADLPSGSLPLPRILR